MRYFGRWHNYAKMKEDWGKVVDGPFPQKHEVLWASYGGLSYEGDALVIFEHDGKVWEGNGSHCSCYGLSESDYSGVWESQWHPEETSWKALAMRRESLVSNDKHEAEAIAAFDALIQTKSPQTSGG